ncbi:MAG: pantoate--beta-alanine ligase [Planctomycetes bacterium]|nr:pantoate--beta-alanine ligase [Planctomycetota bacterium]
MDVVRSIDEIRLMVKAVRDRDSSIGFVPTMGALHEGHMSLMRRARKECGELIVSIFVNLIQFDSGDDLAAYPHQLETDIEIADKEDVDIVFVPSREEIYPEGFCTFVEQGELAERLCGKMRPGHFRGVTTIVTKLFNIIGPDRAYFGQKDYQQSEIIKRLVQDLNMDVNIEVLPVIREKDGLALSSRNSHLNAVERSNARCIYDALLKARSMIEANERGVGEIINEMEKIINLVPNSKIDYVSLVDPDTLDDVSSITGRVVAAVAVWIGSTRLIDNIMLEA